MLLNCGVWRKLQSTLDSKEIQPVNPKGNRSWIFIGRTDAEAEAPILWPPVEELIHLKRPWCWERLEAGEGDDRGWDGWKASWTPWTWIWVSSWSWWCTGKPGVLQSMGLQSQTRLSHWTELSVYWNAFLILIYILQTDFTPPPQPGSILCCWRRLLRVS